VQGAEGLIALPVSFGTGSQQLPSNSFTAETPMCFDHSPRIRRKGGGGKYMMKEGDREREDRDGNIITKAETRQNRKIKTADNKKSKV
jgi:hypothetical protein